MRLDELSTYIDNYGSDLSNGMYSTLSAKLGGEVRIPKLTQADGLNIELDATGVIPIGQLTRFDGGRILVSNTNKAFNGLVEATDTDIEVVGGSGNFPALKYIDGNSLLVSGGGVLSLPLVTTYSHGSTGNNQQRVLQAKGASSRLELPNAQLISGGTHYNSRIFVNALEGGFVDLSKVTQIADLSTGDLNFRSIDVSANGTGSLVRLDELSTYIDNYGSDLSNGMYSTLSAKLGGEVRIPKLTQADGLNIELDATGVIPIGQLTRFDGGRILVSNTNKAFNGLVEATDTDIEVVGGSGNFPALKYIDGNSLLVSGGGVLSLPLVTTYSHGSTGNNQQRVLQAKGASSRLELPNAQLISGGTHYNSRIFVNALEGGVVDLSKVTQIVDQIEGDRNYRAIDIVSNGNSSLVKLNSLLNFLDRDGTSRSSANLQSLIEQSSGGRIDAPLLRTILNVVKVGAIATGQSSSGNSNAGNGNATTQSLIPRVARWIGTGGGNWSDTKNWQDGLLPRPIDEILVENLAPAHTILLDIDQVAKSLSISSSLTIAGGKTLSVVGIAAIAGNFRTESNATVSVTGSDSSLQITGTANVDGSNLIATAGGEIRLPQVTSYAHKSTSNNQQRTIRVDGAGSLIDLSGVTSISGGTHYNSRLSISAYSGGVINLSKTQSITDPATGDGNYRSIDVSSTGVGSLVRLDALTSFIDQYAFDFGAGIYSSLSATQGGEVRVPLLTNLQGVNLVIGRDSTIATNQIVSFISGRISVSNAGDVSFPNLTAIVDTDFEVEKSLLQLPLITKLEGNSLTALARGEIRLPQVTSYDHKSTSNNQQRTIRVDGAGSLIDLSGVTSISGGTHYNSRLSISAYSGGVINLSKTQSITDPATGDGNYRSIDVSSTGVGSLVRLDALTSFIDQYAFDFGAGIYSSLSATQGGEVRVPLLTNLQGVNLVIGRDSTIATNQIVSFISGRISVSNAGDVSFPNLTAIVDTDFEVEKSLLQLPLITKLEGNSLTALARGEIRLPQVTSYDHKSTSNNQQRTIRVDGAGSLIDLSGVTSISGGTHYNSRLSISAYSGGVINLSKTQSITDPVTGDGNYRSIDVSSTGVGSLVRLDALTSFIDQYAFDFGAGIYSSLSATQGGEVRVPLLTNLQGVNLAIGRDSTISTNQMISFISGRISVSNAGDVSFPNLTAIVDTDFEVEKSLLQLPLITKLEGNSLTALARGEIRLPQVTSYAHKSTGNNQQRTIRVDGAGSLIDLSGVTSILGGTHYNSHLSISAYSGGVINLSKTQSITDPATGDVNYRSIDVSSTGVGSLVRLDALTSFIDQNAYDFGAGLYSSLSVAQGGEVRAPLLTNLQGVSLSVRSDGIMSLTQIIEIDRGRLELEGNGRVFDLSSLVRAPFTVIEVTSASLLANSLRMIDGASLKSSDGSILQFPSVETYSHASTANSQTRRWISDGLNSVISLPNLRSILNGTHYDSHFGIEAWTGGKVLLPKVTTIDDPDTGDKRRRSLHVIAEGIDTNIDLSSLIRFSDSSFGSLVGDNRSSSVDVRYGAILNLGSAEISGTQIVLGDYGKLQGTVSILASSTLAGSGTYEGNLTNSGTILPSGKLRIVGNLTSTGILGFDIGGLVPATEHDQIDVTGTVSLEGTINLLKTNGFLPKNGQSIRVMTFNGRDSKFPNFTGLDFGGDAAFSPEFSPTNLAFNVGFSSGPRVLSITPSDSVLYAFESPFIEVLFSESVDPATFTLADVVVTGPSGQTIVPKSVLAVQGKSDTFRISLLADGFVDGQYTLSLGPDIRDFVGNAMNQNDNQVNGEVQDLFTGNVNLRLPDLVLSDVSYSTAQFQFGDSFNIRWKVTNAGQVNANAPWIDRLLLSKDSTASFDDIVLGSLAAGSNSPLASGSFYQNEQTVTIPTSDLLSAGEYFLIVITDASLLLSEKVESNNTVVNRISVTYPPSPDLQVVSFTAPQQARAGESLSVAYSIRNLGELTAQGSWRDSIYLSLDGTETNAILMASFLRNTSLAMGTSYDETRSVLVPSIVDGNYKLFIRSDSGNSVFEAGRESNNTLFATTDLAVKNADLVPKSLSSPAQSSSGQSIAISWQTENHGTGATVGGWTDRLYLSNDDSFSGNDRLLGSFTHSSPLNAGGIANANMQISLPEDMIGSFYLLVIADALGQVSEPTKESNNTASTVVTISLSPFADLVVSNVIAPTQTIGDPATVSVAWAVTNHGTGAGKVSSWTDSVIASTNSILGDTDDIVLGSFVRTGQLLEGQSYSRRESIVLPPAFTGRFELFVKSDALSEVFENGNESNNAARFNQPFDVMPIPYADLVVRKIETLGTAATGQPLQIRWTIANQGIGLTSVGDWTDSVFLASDPLGDQPLTEPQRFLHFGHLSPGGQYERTIELRVPDSAPATIYIVVRAADPENKSVIVPFEFIYGTNNRSVSAAVSVTSSPSPDLHVESILNPTTALEGGPLDVTWTVRNIGQATASGTWVDRVVMRQVGVTNPTEHTLGVFQRTIPLAAGLSYSRTDQVRLPYQVQGVFELSVITDADDAVFERTPLDANNRGISSTTLLVGIRPRPDLQVDPGTVQAPPEIESGAVITVGFEVINQGPVPTTGITWSDRVYLSLDNRLSQDDLLISDLPSKSALGLGDRYLTISDSVTVPLRFRGDMFLLLQTDARGQVDEWPNEENNLYARPLRVIPKPLADLVVGNVIVPPQTSDGDDLSVSFTVSNLGSGATNTGEWVDTIWLTRDKNRPHPGQGDILLKSINHSGSLVRNASYDVATTVKIPAGIDPGIWYVTPWSDPYDVVVEDTLVDNTNPDEPNQLDNNNYKAHAIDVLAKLPDLQVTQLTSSASANGGDVLQIQYRVENRGNAPATTKWKDRVYLSDIPNPLDRDARSLLLAEVPHVDSLEFGTGYTRNLSIQLSPSAVGQYLVVLTDAVDGSTVFHIIKEVSEDNNSRLASINVAPIPADLQVTSVTFEPDTISGESTLVRYTVTNTGALPVWSGTEYWRDFLWISADKSFIRRRASYMGEVSYQYARLLNPGDSYEIVTRITLPQGTSGDYYLHIHLNANNDLSPNVYKYESRILRTDLWPGDKGVNQDWVEFYQRWAYEDPNNNLYSAYVPIEYREPDLQITSLNIPTTAHSGQTIPISFTVKNNGNRDTRVGNWTDRLFISHDASLDSKDFELAALPRNQILKAGESYTSTSNVTLPEGIGGEFHILAYTDSAAYRDPHGTVKSDIGFYLIGTLFESDNPLEPWDLASVASRSLGRGRVLEFQQEGNNIHNRLLPVTLVTPADLQVTSVIAPTRVDRGQLIDILYTATNRGGSTTPSQSKWSDLIYLSRDPVLDLTSDRYIGMIDHRGGLEAGKSYSNSFQFQIPTDLIGPWYAIVVTDPIRRGVIGDVFEGDREQNNSTASPQPIVIQLPPPSDLEVVNVSVPSTAKPGEPINLSWTVKNNSPESAKGTWFDTVYLSSNSVWDPSDPIVGRMSYTGNLQAGQSYVRQLNAKLPAVIPGNYRFIVRTDTFDNIYESTSESNNTTVAAEATLVSVERLQLGVPFPTNLVTGQERLMEVVVPAGETLRVKLQLEDSDATTEMYIRYDNSPSSVAYDAIGEIGKNSSQAALIPTTRPGSYYILIRGNQVAAAKSAITVLAELLPLAITDIRSDVAGDGKYFTTTIRGSKFAQNASLTLERPGYGAFAPVSMKVVDATTIRAIFDFTDAPHGLYDVKISQPGDEAEVIPYRFLIQDSIEPDVTVGIGGPRIVMAGDTGRYSVSFQSLSNLDTPYVYYQVGVPELGINKEVYGLPYLHFFTNAQGTPPSDSLNDIPWADLNPIVNTDGYRLASGYILDQEADGSTGFSFAALTYPGLKEMANRSFDDFKARLYAAFPRAEEQGILDNGIDGLDRLLPGLSIVWRAFGGIPGLWEKGFIPFQFNVSASATALTREEFISHSLGEADQLRAGIISSTNAPPTILALAADRAAFGQLYLAALEQAGILLPDGTEPEVRESSHLVSSMATLSSGILAGPAGQSVQGGDLHAFFEQLRGWYGNNDDTLAPIDPNATRFSAPTFDLPPILGDANPIAKLRDFADYDLGAASRTRLQSLRVYVPWVAWDARAGLPAEYLITGITPFNEDPFLSVDLSRFLSTNNSALGMASIIGPFTSESNGFVPVGKELPYTVRFQNPASASTVTSEVRILVPLDANADARTFRLGDIQVGSLPPIQVPTNQPSFQGDFDFTATRGFILRVNGGVDLASKTASWVLQAIDPATGELIRDPAKGLLPPNDSQGAGSAYVNFTIRSAEDASTGDVLSMNAKILLNNSPPEDTPTIRVRFDADLPTSTLTLEQTDATTTVRWNAEDQAGGSGLKHVTLYVSEDGGPYRIWQKELTDPTGTATYQGEAGRTYRFLSLATDRAGNRQAPPSGNFVADDDAVSNADATNAIPVDLGPPPTPTPNPSSNALFVTAERGIPATIDSAGGRTEFSQVLQPVSARPFATGFVTGDAGIGPMGVTEAPDGMILVTGGAKRNLIFRYGRDGGNTSTPWATLDLPVYSLAFDRAGNLWATTGGGPLLQLDPGTGEILARFGDGITLSVAPSPTSSEIYVTTGRGIEIFDPVSQEFRLYNRDRNLRFADIDFAPDGTLWGILWPERNAVVRFTPNARVEVMFEFDTPIDSLAFGKTGSVLDGLLFVTHNSGQDGHGGDLTMIDLVTLRQVKLAENGSRGDAVTTTTDGRIFVSQSQQVDVLNAQLEPFVIGTNPPNNANVALPFSLISIAFDQEMQAGDPSAFGSAINPENFQLLDETGFAAQIRRINYDPITRTALLIVSGLGQHNYTLTVSGNIKSKLGIAMRTPNVTRFTTLESAAPLVSLTFSNSRLERTTQTISYDVTITNRSDRPLILPLYMVLDAANGYAGVPVGGQGEVGKRWVINFAGNVPGGVNLPALGSTNGRTVSILSPDGLRVNFANSVSASIGPNAPPAFTSTPITEAAVGNDYAYRVSATDPDGSQPIFLLVEAPSGMTLDSQTGQIHWRPFASHAIETRVIVRAYDPQGAWSEQLFTIHVAGGNHPPVIAPMQRGIERFPGSPMVLQLSATDQDGDPLRYWATSLPPGSVFDPETRALYWTPNTLDVGIHGNVRFVVSDGKSETNAFVDITVLPRNLPPMLKDPGGRILREGDALRILLSASDPDDDSIIYTATNLPEGAILHPTTGELTWTPGYKQQGIYEVTFTAWAGGQSTSIPTMFMVLNANAIPEFDAIDRWRVSEDQTIEFRVLARDPDNPDYLPPTRMADGTLFYTSDSRPTITYRPTRLLPDGATFDAETGIFRWRPSFNQAGSYEVRFIATDDGDGVEAGATTSIRIPIDVLNQNLAPVIPAIPKVTVARDASHEFVVTVTDADGDPITLSATSALSNRALPEFIRFTDLGGGRGRFTIAPGIGDRGNHPVTLTAVDYGPGGERWGRLTTSYDFIVEATSANDPPVLSYIGDRVAIVGQQIEIALQSYDLDEETLTYSFTDLPGAQVVPGARYGEAILRWTPTVVGTNATTVTVSDGGNGAAGQAISDSELLQIVVRNSNAAPQSTTPGRVLGDEGTSLRFQVTAADANTDKLRFSANADLPAGAQLDPATGTLTWTPSFAQAGEHPVSITISDGNSNADASFIIEVRDTNLAPLLVPVSPQFAREGAGYRLLLSGADPDSDPLTFTITGLPAGAKFDATSRTLTWTPGFDQSGDYTLVIAASDPRGGSDSMNVRLRVDDVNRTPVLVPLDRAGVVGQLLQFQLLGSDPDNDPLRYRALRLPEGASINEQTGVFTWTPVAGQAGDYIVTFLLSDGQNEDRQPMLLRVTNEAVLPDVRIELVPSFPSQPNQEVQVRVTASSLVGIASIILYADGQEVLLDSQGRGRILPTGPGQITLEAIAEDRQGTAGRQVRSLKVIDPADTSKPIVSLANTLTGRALSERTDVVGSVVDSNLDNWTLSIAPWGTDHFVELTSNIRPVDGKLAEINPTRLANGIYRLRLAAVDIGERRTETELKIEINSTNKSGIYRRSEIDTSYDKMGGTLKLERIYDSSMTAFGSSFGDGWRWAELDFLVQTDAPLTGRESLGLYDSLRDGSRLYASLPDGSRVGFTFSPEAMSVGGLTYYKPRWQTDAGVLATLTSADAMLVRVDGKYFELGSGLPYHPSNGLFKGANYRIQINSGKQYELDAHGRTTAIVFGPGCSLVVTDSNIQAEGKTYLSLVRDSQGRVSRVSTTPGNYLEYTYLPSGQLSQVTDEAGTVQSAYRYDVQRRLDLSASTKGSESVSYIGAVITDPVQQYLGPIQAFTGKNYDFVRTTAQQRFVIQVTAEQLASTPRGEIMLQVVTEGVGGSLPPVASFDGAVPVSRVVQGTKATALFIVRQAGLDMLRVSGPGGQYRLSVGIAGDINHDSLLDASDGGLLQDAIGQVGRGETFDPIADINGDGSLDYVDRLAMIYSFGFTTSPSTFALPTNVQSVVLESGSDDSTPLDDNTTSRASFILAGTSRPFSRVVLADTDKSAITLLNGMFAFFDVPLLVGPNPFVVSAGGNLSAGFGAGVTVTRIGQETTPPMVEFSLLHDTGWNSRDRATFDPTLSGTAVDASGIRRLELASDNGPWIDITTQLSNGRFELTATELTTILGSLPDGVYDLRLRAFDALENVSEVINYSFVLDTVALDAPVQVDLLALSDTGLNDSDNLTNKTEVVLGALAAANSRVEVLVDGRVVSTTLAPGRFTVPVTLPGPGSFSITMIARDDAGNASPASTPLTIVVDQTSPATISAGLSADTDTGIVGDSRTDLQTVSITGVTNIGASVVLYRASDTKHPVMRVMADGSGAYRLDDIHLASGINPFTVAAEDAAGNAKPTSLTIETTATDTLAPTIAAGLLHDTGRSTTDRITSDATVIVTVDDPSGISSLTAAINGEALQNVLGWLDGTRLTLTSDRLTSLLGAPTADGVYTLTFKAIDVVGHASENYRFTYTLDTRAPVPPAALDLSASEDTGTSNTDNITRNNAFLLTTSVDNDAIVRFYQNGNFVSQSSSGTTRTLSVTNLSDGTHIFTVTSEDIAGNVSSFSLPASIIVDRTAPSELQVSLADEFRDSPSSLTTAYESVTLIGKTDPNTVVMIEGTTRSVVSDANGDFQFTDVRLIPGANQFTLSATDNAGNIKTYSSTITLEDRLGPHLEAKLQNDTGLYNADGVTNDPTVTGLIRDASGVRSFEVRFNDGVWKNALPFVSNGFFTFDKATFQQIFGNAMSTGSHRVDFRGVDTLGNSSSFRMHFVFDDLRPAILAPYLLASSDTGISENDHVVNSDSIVVRLPVPKNQKVTWFDNGNLFASGFVDQSGNFTLSSLAEGIHSFTASVEDIAGNISTESLPLQITVDTSTPDIQLHIADRDDTGLGGSQNRIAKYKD